MLIVAVVAVAVVAVVSVVAAVHFGSAKIGGVAWKIDKTGLLRALLLAYLASGVRGDAAGPSSPFVVPGSVVLSPRAAFAPRETMASAADAACSLFVRPLHPEPHQLLSSLHLHASWPPPLDRRLPSSSCPFPARQETA